MEFVVLGWPPDGPGASDGGPKLRLDHERFAYAGKFVMTNTGKAVARVTTEEGEGEDVVAAAAFNADRTDERVLWVRYVTVARERRGEGIGPRLCAFVAGRALDRDYERVRIAVNNPFAYEALYKAGFAFTGEETGIAELVLERPGDRRSGPYRAGLDRFRERDLSDNERAFLREREGAAPPATVR